MFFDGCVREAATGKTLIYSVFSCVGGTSAFSEKRENHVFFLHFSWDFFRKGRRLRFFIDFGSILAPIGDQLGTKSRKKGVPKTHRKTCPKKVMRVFRGVCR